MTFPEAALAPFCAAGPSSPALAMWCFGKEHGANSRHLTGPAGRSLKPEGPFHYPETHTAKAVLRCPFCAHLYGQAHHRMEASEWEVTCGLPG